MGILSNAGWDGAAAGVGQFGADVAKTSLENDEKLKNAMTVADHTDRLTQDRERALLQFKQDTEENLKTKIGGIAQEAMDKYKADHPEATPAQILQAGGLAVTGAGHIKEGHDMFLGGAYAGLADAKATNAGKPKTLTADQKVQLDKHAESLIPADKSFLHPLGDELLKTEGKPEIDLSQVKGARDLLVTRLWQSDGAYDPKMKTDAIATAKQISKKALDVAEVQAKNFFDDKGSPIKTVDPTVVKSLGLAPDDLKSARAFKKAIYDQTFEKIMAAVLSGDVPSETRKAISDVANNPKSVATKPAAQPQPKETPKMFSPSGEQPISGSDVFLGPYKRGVESAASIPAGILGWWLKHKNTPSAPEDVYGGIPQ
jgi:hypothetical protein